MIFPLLFLFVWAADYVDLVTFDGSDGTSFGWKLLNDPVMGGVSNSTWTVDKNDGMAHWIGDCRIVPSLQAPGFCNAETSDGYFTKFNDARGFKYISILLRSRIDYKGMKLSFAANTFNPQFKCYKADFNVTSNGGWQIVHIALNQFSKEWSPSTGEPTKTCAEHPEVCPKDSDLAKIQQVGFWMEGVEGKFDVDIKWVRATNGPTKLENKLSNTCQSKPQRNLRWNISQITWSGDGETMTEAICCDSDYAGLAEPQYLFQQLKLFSQLDSAGTNIFYDPVCGLPLFRAPIGRSFEDFQNESNEHGWPSFRDEERVQENLVLKDNVLYSKCNTRLGDNLPDDKGNRYCLDLVCLAGHSKTLN